MHMLMSECIASMRMVLSALYTCYLRRFTLHILCLRDTQCSKRLYVEQMQDWDVTQGTLFNNGTN